MGELERQTAMTIRTAAVAGSFYPADPRSLRDALAAHLRAAGSPVAADRCPKIVLAPHAGYIYSGDVAALAYAPLARWRDRIRRVVLLGPVHRVAVRGLAAPTVTAFETPLGRLPLDAAALASLRELPQVVWSDRPHAGEHSLEVQLPFLQAVLGEGFTLVPLAVGDASPAEVAEVLERLWGGDETLIVISSDLSHYLPYHQAQAADRATAQRILDLATDLVGEEACGAAPLNGALLAAKRHGLTPRLLGLRNSADIPGGDRRRVVGYGAVAFDTPAAPAAEGDDAALGKALVQAARRSIADALNDGRIQCDLCPRDCKAARGPARRLLRAPARRRRDGAHHLRPLVRASASTRSRRSRSTTSTPARACSPSAPPAATSPASSARTGTSPSRARWTR
jgi:AmmeMemoRadiSam system protein B